MSVAYTEIREDIELLVANPHVRDLAGKWNQLIKSADARGGLPDFEEFSTARWNHIERNMMVLRPTGNDFFYEHYGANILAASGFDMQGKQTSNFNSEVGEFFRSVYVEVERTRRPIYTIHQGGHSRRVVSWERLLLPVEKAPSGGDDGLRIVGYNAPLDDKTALFDGLLYASLDAITIMRPVFKASPEGLSNTIEDFEIISANEQARSILDIKEQFLAGVYFRRVGGALAETTISRVEDVWRSGEPQRFDRQVVTDTEAAVYRASLTRSDDKIIMVMSDITGIKKSEQALELQRSDLMKTNATLARTAQDLETALAKAEMAEQFATSLLQAIPVPVFYRDRRTGHYARVNKPYADLYGMTTDAMIGQPLSGITDETWAKQVADWDESLYDSNDDLRVRERYMKFPDLGTRRVASHRAVLKDGMGEKQGIIGVLMDVTEAHELRLELERLATTDSLTGLANRRMFMERAGHEIARSRRHGRPFSVIMMDVDRFKSINDSFGHAAGDKVLIEVGRIISQELRQGIDVAARFGGEEFAALLPETDGQAATAVAERLRHALESERVDASGDPVTFTASFGVAVGRGDDTSIEDSLRRADLALYKAKELGRNRVVSEDGPEAA